mgnify:CR=1 FL=1
MAPPVVTFKVPVVDMLVPMVESAETPLTKTKESIIDQIKNEVMNLFIIQSLYQKKSGKTVKLWIT